MALLNFILSFALLSSLVVFMWWIVEAIFGVPGTSIIPKQIAVLSEKIRPKVEIDITINGKTEFHKSL